MVLCFFSLPDISSGNSRLCPQDAASPSAVACFHDIGSTKGTELHDAGLSPRRTAGRIHERDRFDRRVQGMAGPCRDGGGHRRLIFLEPSCTSRRPQGARGARAPSGHGWSGKATGIGSWTDDQFYKAMHEGIGADGEYLYPVFPFPWFTKLTRDDVLAIKAYLFSLPPQDAPRRPMPDPVRWPSRAR
jgi:hypothetical protein